MSKHKTKRRIMRKFTINEISGVDKPAQSGARMVIMKRAEDPEQIAKRAQMTTSIDGHAHLLDDDTQDGGHTSWVLSEGAEFTHSHPWIKKDDGTIVIGEADGHTHKLIKVTFKSIQSEKIDETSNEDDPVTKSNPAGKLGGNIKESLMADEVKKTADEMTAENDSLQKDLAKAKTFGEFNDAEKEYYGALDDTQKATFIEKSADDRKAEVDAAKAEDPVVYKSSDGTEFRKSDDPRLIELSKKADDADKLAKVEKELRENAEFVKRASDELSHLPGEENAKVDLLKAIDGIEDEAKRKAVSELVKANNEAMAKAFETKGTSGAPAENSAAGQLDSLAKKHAEDNKVTYAKAYDTVLQTAEGKTLYEQTLN